MFANHTAGGDDGYQIANSLRLRSSASAYLSRTPSVAGNTIKWTWAGWVKRGTFSGLQPFLAGGNAANEWSFIGLSGEVLRFYCYVSAGLRMDVQTTPVCRDPSAWYHVVFVYDAGQAAAADRQVVYVNGVRVTSYSVATYTNLASHINGTTLQTTGAVYNGAVWSNFDGYLSNIHFIDGQALTPSSFGEFNTDGVWVPKKYTGTYGTNGFYLPFNDGSNLTTLGYDRSGNGNNWTLNNVSLTAGATYDWMVDTPTNNYATLSPLAGNQSLSNANLTFTSVSAESNRPATIGVTSGKWYAEFTISGAAGQLSSVGVVPPGLGSVSPGTSPTNTGFSYYGGNGGIYTNGASVLTVSTYGAGAVISVAYDADTGKAWVAKDGVWQNSGNPAAGTGQVITLSTSGIRLISAGSGAGGTASQDANFGQRPFAYTPPTGFKALCTANMPAVGIPNGRKHFAAELFAGDGSDKTIGFSWNYQFNAPADLVWVKNRGSAVNHIIEDSVRGFGSNKLLHSNTTEAEGTNTTSGYVSAVSSGGMSYDAGPYIGANANSYVAWLWKAGGAAVTNNAGSITSQVSANPLAGFSIVTYTGTGANATVGHGLGVAPKLIIVKGRTTAFDWPVYHAGMNATPQNGTMYLSATNAYAAASTVWNNTAPTSSVFSIGTGSGVNSNAAGHVAYCFAEVPGFSKFGSYTGNGSADGPFVYTGGSGGYLLIKRTDVAGYSWCVYDSARNPANVTNLFLTADGSIVEQVGTTRVFDFTSNGFKVRGDDAGINASGGTYIYAWFARNPFGGSNVAPATAR